MKVVKWLLLQAILTFFCSTSAMALPTLYDWAFNVDGVMHENYYGDSMPVSPGSLDSQTGLGIINWTVATPGDHSFTAFFDFQFVDQSNRYFDEFGTAVGTQSTGQTWEIDEPSNVFGDIYDHLLDGTLDNSNAVPNGMEDDVSFAMDWDFSLEDGEDATVTFVLSQVMPDIGFYLAHSDFQSGEAVYFSSSLELSTPAPAPVPEPTTLTLVSTSLAVLCGVKRRKSASLHWKKFSCT